MRTFSILMLGVLFFLSPLSSQEADSEIPESIEDKAPPSLAILIQGPSFTKGIPFLDPNALEAFTGRYIMGEEEIIVFFTEEPLIIPDMWERFVCGRKDYLTFFFGDGKGYYMESPKDWSVFIFFTHPDTNHCLFLTRFENRLNYFLQISSTFSFPAVLELD